jgi:urease accessory protein
MLRATSIVRAQYLLETPWDNVIMDAGERHLRRKLVKLQRGDNVLVDLPQATKLEDRDCLRLEDGRLIQIIASDEDLMEVTARDTAHLVQLAWHIGNRHLEMQIDSQRVLIRSDHVIAQMLNHLGATVRNVREPFSPERGAYSHAH